MVHPPRTLDQAPFSGVMHFPADMSKFQIVKNGQVLAEVPVSANEPTVSNVSPAGATTLNGPYTITWNGSDPDGGDLTYTVEYNPDVTNPASSWMVLAEDLETQTRSWQEDFRLLPGGSHTKIQIMLLPAVGFSILALSRVLLERGPAPGAPGTVRDDHRKADPEYAEEGVTSSFVSYYYSSIISANRQYRGSDTIYGKNNVTLNESVHIRTEVPHAETWFMERIKTIMRNERIKI